MSILTTENKLEIVNLLEKMRTGDPTVNFTKLQEYEGKPGFCTVLNDISIDSSFTMELKLASVIELKNTVNRYWKTQQKKSNPISDEERKTLKENLFLLIETSSGALLDFRGIILAIIIRKDFPKESIDIITRIIEAILTKNDKIFPNFLHTLRIIMKEFKNLHIMMLVKQLRSLIFQILQTQFFTIYQEITQLILNGNMNYSQIFEDYTKILCNMLKKCDVNDSVEVSNQINCIFTYYVTILPTLSQLQVKDEHIIKALKNITKLFVFYQYDYPIFFIPFIESTINSFTQILFNFNNFNYPPVMIVKALSFIGNILTTRAYVTNPSERQISLKGKVEITVEQYNYIRNIIVNFFNDEKIGMFMELIMKKYYIMNSDQINQFFNYPEDYISKEKDDELRKSVESFFCGLLEFNPTTVNNKLIQYANILNSNINSLTDEDILLYDTFLSCLGLGSYCLPEFPFMEFYNGRMIPLFQLQISDKNLPINLIIRRNIWAISCWTFSLKENEIMILIQFLYSILSINPSIPVKIESIQTLTIYLELLEHKTTIYQTMNITMFNILNLNDNYSREIVVKFLACIFKHSGDTFYPLLPTLINEIVGLIDIFIEQTPLFSDYISLINLLVNILKLRNINEEWYNIINTTIVSVLYKCFVLNKNENKSYIIMDTLELFINVLTVLPIIPQDLIELIPELYEIVDDNIESIPNALYIIQWITSKDNDLRVLNKFSIFSNEFFSKVTSMTPENKYKIAIETCERLLISYPNINGLNLINNILKDVLTSICKDTTKNDYFIACDLCLICRFVIQFPSEWIAFLKIFCDDNIDQMNQVCKILIDKYIEYYENVGLDSIKKKYWIYGILSLITTIKDKYEKILDDIYSILKDDYNYNTPSPDSPSDDISITSPNIIQANINLMNEIYKQKDPLIQISSKNVISQFFVTVKTQLGIEFDNLLTTFDQVTYNNVIKYLQ